MIHKEGWPSIIIVTVANIVLIILGVYVFPAFQWASILLAILLWITILQFFRNPQRNISVQEKKVLYAPADGKIVVIEKTHESEWLQEDCMQISIFMSPINVHVNRIPLDSEVEYYKYHPGKYLVAWHPKSSTDNERTSLGLRASNGARILLRQIAGALARRIVCYSREGDTVLQGQEFGFIKFGSRVDIFVPLNTEIMVQLGQKVSGNVTAIARLV
jgi:phosphatidylserine decarboxylase